MITHIHTHRGQKSQGNNLIKSTSIKIIQLQNKNTRNREDMGKQESSFTARENRNCMIQTFGRAI